MRFIQAGTWALEELNLYGALSIALIIPDICGSLEDPGPGRTEKRYTAWVDRWVIPKLLVNEAVGQRPLKASDYFKLRNSMIHSGSADLGPRKDSNLREFIFCDRGVAAHLMTVTIDGVARIQLSVDRFCADIFIAAHEWDLAMADNAAVQDEKKKLLVIQSGPVRIGSVQIE